MAFAPITFVATNYRDYKNWWLKAYEPGTTTPKPMSDNDTGSPQAAKYEIDKDGWPVTSGGAIVNPYIDGDYDIWLFPTEADADANDTTNALRLADDLSSPGSNIGGFASYEFDTVSDFKNGILIGGNTVIVKPGDTLRIKERGDADFDCVAGTAGENDIDIISDGTNTAVLRIQSKMDSKNFGAASGVDSTANYENAVNQPNLSHLIISELVPTSKAITISRDNIKVDIANTMTRVVENPLPIAERGIFTADGQTDIEINGNFDLKGEGSRNIGVAELIENEYNTTSGQTGISGPANSAVFFVRCSNIRITGRAEASGEVGYLLRNCGDVDMDVAVENCSNAGVELSFPASDGSSATMPIRENYTIKCDARYVNDLKLGAGNGTAVSMAGSAVNEVFRNFDIEVWGYRNSREIHQEFNAGARIENFRHKVFSRDALQGAIATQGRHGTVEGVFINGGSGGTGALNTGYPDLYGYRGSANSDDVKVKMQIISTNDDGFTTGSTGVTSAGSNVFTDTNANFPTDIVGKAISIGGANPSGANFEAYVLNRDSATQLTLDLNAGATVLSANYAYGTGCRTPMSFSGSGSVDFSGSTIIGGVFSNLPGEPPARAIGFNFGGGQSAANNVLLQAPSLIGTASAPVGLYVSASFTGPISERSNIIEGFDEAYSGFAAASSAIRCPINRQLVQDANPDAAADTYGPVRTFEPRNQTFDYFSGISIEFDFDGAASGTLTAELEAFFVDGGSNTQTFNATSDSTIELTTGQLATLQRDNQKITSLTFKAKNSGAGRQTDRARLSFVGIES